LLVKALAKEEQAYAICFWEAASVYFEKVYNRFGQ
jgi:hypothetical protein